MERRMFKDKLMKYVKKKWGSIDNRKTFYYPWRKQTEKKTFAQDCGWYIAWQIHDGKTGSSMFADLLVVVFDTYAGGRKFVWEVKMKGSL